MNYVMQEECYSSYCFTACSDSEAAICRPVEAVIYIWLTNLCIVYKQALRHIQVVHLAQHSAEWTGLWEEMGGDGSLKCPLNLARLLLSNLEIHQESKKKKPESS